MSLALCHAAPLGYSGRSMVFFFQILCVLGLVGAGFFVGSGLISILAIGFVFLAKSVSTVPY